MLENTNDFMSVLVVVFILLAIVAIGYRAFSINTTAKHLRQEADYYSYRNDKQIRG